MAGYSGKPLVQKLGIKPGFRIFVGGAPGAYSDIVGRLPAGVTITSRLKAPLDMVHLFATNASELASGLRGAREAISPDGVVWVSWPKKASKVLTDVTEGVVRAEALKRDLVDVKVAAVNEIWSGLKLVIRKDLR